LCPEKDTQRVTSSPRWDEWLDFDIDISDIPRGAQLCCSICSVSRRSRKREDHCLVAWGNLQMFDYRSVLISDKYSLNLWPAPRGLQDELLIPLGIAGSNPNKDSPCLELEFTRWSYSVMYPNMDVVKAFAEQVLENDRAARAKENKAGVIF
jgi:phosphatidylinositol-4,5-bisphosphate 3-kinase